MDVIYGCPLSAIAPRATMNQFPPIAGFVVPFPRPLSSSLCSPSLPPWVLPQCLSSSLSLSMLDRWREPPDRSRWAGGDNCPRLNWISGWESIMGWPPPERSQWSLKLITRKDWRYYEREILFPHPAFARCFSLRFSLNLEYFNTSTFSSKYLNQPLASSLSFILYWCRLSAVMILPAARKSSKSKISFVWNRILIQGLSSDSISFSGSPNRRSTSTQGASPGPRRVSKTTERKLTTFKMIF